MSNDFNNNKNKKNLNGDSISYTTYRTNYPNDEAMKENGGVPSGGSLNLENNKEINITENGDIEITPNEGKDGMKKVTAHVNVSGGGGSGNFTAYAWVNNGGFVEYFDFDISPSSSGEFAGAYKLNIEANPSTGYPSGIISVQSTRAESSFYSRASDTQWGIVGRETSVFYTRDSSKDLIAWSDGGGSDIPSAISLPTYDSDGLLLYGDKTKITKIFTFDMGGWVDNPSITTDAILFSGGKLYTELPVLCVEYNGKMYKAPSELTYDLDKYNFTEVQSQATPPTSDTPSGTVTSGTIIHLSTTETGGTIYYATYDNIPVEYSDDYGIEIYETTPIKAVVVVDGKFTSEVLELEFTVE